MAVNAWKEPACGCVITIFLSVRTLPPPTGMSAVLAKTAGALVPADDAAPADEAPAAGEAAPAGVAGGAPSGRRVPQRRLAGRQPLARPRRPGWRADPQARCWCRNERIQPARRYTRRRRQPVRRDGLTIGRGARS